MPVLSQVGRDPRRLPRHARSRAHVAVVLVVLMTVLAACSNVSVGTAERALPTPRSVPNPAPTPSDTFEPTVELVAPPTAPAEQAPSTGPPAFSTTVDLDVYAQPGGEGEIIGLILGGTEGLITLDGPFAGEDGRTWWLVLDDNLQGWVTPGDVVAGSSRDVTSEITQLLGLDPYTSFDSMALAIADIYASTDPPSGRSIVSRAETPPTITVDVTLLGDDSIAGVRLVITLNRAVSSEVTRADIATVLQQPLCIRGITTDGRCS